MRCAYANIGSADQPRLIHYRTAGSGPPLVMLHASPLSSKMLMPLAVPLSEHCKVLALDTPGYGQSDSLPEDPTGQGLTQYVEALERFRIALGFEKIGVYGTATGAQIGVGYARAYPEHCAFLVADNAAHFSDEERNRLLDGYFPEIPIDDLGGHLMRTWSLARDQMLFFPWQDHGSRLPQGGLNPVVSNLFANQILAAGPNYAWAYREAFVCENVALLQEVTVPTSVIRWEGSIVKPYTDLFDDYEFGDNFRMVPCGPTMDQRAAALVDEVNRYQALVPVNAATDDLSVAAEPRTYLGGFHLHIAGSGKPLVILHQPGFNAAAIGSLTMALSEKRRCIVPDLPGHGASPPADGFLRDVVNVYQQILDTLESAPEILAIGESASLGFMLAQQFNSALTLLNPRSAAMTLPDLEPTTSGAHWVQAWHWLRMRQMFAPWNEPQPANALGGTPMLDGHTLTGQLNAVLACSDIAGTVSQMSDLPNPDPSLGRWFSLGNDPLGDAARQAFPDASWQTPASLNELTELLEH
ncbi:MAG: alpha/beta fold hydrolase [Lysobacterales bacterium]